MFVLWGAFLALVAGVEWALFTHHTPNYYLLVLQPAFAIGGTIALGALAHSRCPDRDAEARPRVVADLSLSSALIGIALAVMLWGSFIGEWLLLIGGGLLVLGLVGLMRELAQARRLRLLAGLEEDQPADVR